MKPDFRMLAAAGALLTGLLATDLAFAQKSGGILRVHALELAAELIDARGSGCRTRLERRWGYSITSSCSTSTQSKTACSRSCPIWLPSWSWSEDGTQLTFLLRQGVKWHDGKPFTANDVKCTWDLLAGKSAKSLRLNPRKSWYRNLAEVTANGDNEVTFHLKRPQPAFIALLASGYSVVYPCHVAPAEMRQHPIGTGPFKFVEFKPNERITLTRNPDYWKPGRPYLDGVEFTIIRDRSTANLAFVAGKVDWTRHDDLAAEGHKEPSARTQFAR